MSSAILFVHLTSVAIIFERKLLSSGRNKFESSIGISLLNKKWEVCCL